MVRLNVGCGQSPTPGWKNYDNSPSIRLAKRPNLVWLLGKLGLLGARQRDFIDFARKSDLLWADVTRHIPEADRSVEVVYSSHMVEHLDRAQALHFLKEVRRVLISGGIIRIAVPNIRYHIDNYLRHNDADQLVEAIHLTRPGNPTFLHKLRYLWVGDRHHLWMYDGSSLSKLLLAAGFENPRVLEPGDTTISEPGALNLHEREPESVFVEAASR